MSCLVFCFVFHSCHLCTIRPWFAVSAAAFAWSPDVCELLTPRRPHKISDPGLAACLPNGLVIPLRRSGGPQLAFHCVIFRLFCTVFQYRPGGGNCMKCKIFQCRVTGSPKWQHARKVKSAEYIVQYSPNRVYVQSTQYSVVHWLSYSIKACLLRPLLHHPSRTTMGPLSWLNPLPSQEG